MKRFLLLATFVCAALFTACEGYDDSELVNRLDNFENRLKKLEELCSQMNTNISSLQTIVNAIQKNDQISAIAPINKDGKEIGYTIVFTSGKSITIYHGNDGKDGQNGADGTNGQNGQDGHTPIIGVKQDIDGTYYWTLDGEWLTDANGNKIKAAGTDGKDGENGTDGEDGTNGTTGADGADGKDGITPQLKIENNYWYVSYDNGATWTQLGKATGEDGKDGADGKDGEDGTNGTNGADGKDGDSFFQDVIEDEDNVYFILADGTTITIAKSKSIELTYIPRYSDGKATVFYSTQEDSYVELDFEVSPASAAADWSEFATVKAVYTQTRATVDFIEMDILDWTADADNGTITVKTSGANLCNEFFDGDQEASARLVIKGDGLNIMSDYIPLMAKEVITTTEYLLTATYKTETDNQNLWLYAGRYGIAGSENTLVSIDYGDGSFGTERSHTYATSGKYTVKFYFEKPITEIAAYAFGSCCELYSIIIPKTVKTIEDYAFSSYSIMDLQLSEVVFENDSSLEKIGDGAFAHTGIETFSIPKSVISIGEFAFTNCTNLTKIIINNYQTFSVYTNGTVSQSLANDLEAFVAFPCGKDNVTNLLIGNTVDEIYSGVFSFCSYIKTMDFSHAIDLKTVGQIGMRCDNLESVTGLNRTKVEKLSGNSFSWCPKMTTITIPANIKYLESCFVYNEQLCDVTLEEGVVSIVDAFNNCSIETITIPSSVTTLNNAFNSNAILEINCKATVPPTLLDSFDTITSIAKIYVPVGSGEAYKAAQYWSDYADMIEEKEM